MIDIINFKGTYPSLGFANVRGIGEFTIVFVRTEKELDKALTPKTDIIFDVRH